MKYEFTDETKTYDGHILHGIKRIFDDKLGGWIESEDNLSQEGNCWVGGGAMVFEDAKVYSDVLSIIRVSMVMIIYIGNDKVY